MTRPHDLLRIDPLRLRQTLILDHPEEWDAAEQFLQHAPFVVIRRALAKQSHLPVGIRGPERHQRFAAQLETAAILEICSPESLRFSSSTRDLPAFHALGQLEQRWSHLYSDWGPTGSTGFELASHAETVSVTSDLDIVVRAEVSLSLAQAQALANATADLPCLVDIQIDTGRGAFALREYLQSPSNLVLRTTSGPVLVDDPWYSSSIPEFHA